MPCQPKKLDRNKRNCTVCNAEFFAFRSSKTRTCAADKCTMVSRARKGRRHGESYSRLHHIWCGMKSRCLHNAKYVHVNVCDEWCSYETFRDWALISGYEDSLEIDRRDNAKGYNPENCRWATRRQQMQNTGIRKQRNKTSRYKGVQYLKHTAKHWRSLGTMNGKPLQIGLFEKEIEAAEAYDAWAKSEYGQVACLNFKEE